MDEVIEIFGVILIIVALITIILRLVQLKKNPAKPFILNTKDETICGKVSHKETQQIPYVNGGSKQILLFRVTQYSIEGNPDKQISVKMVGELSREIGDGDEVQFTVSNKIKSPYNINKLKNLTTNEIIITRTRSGCGMAVVIMFVFTLLLWYLL